MVQLYK